MSERLQKIGKSVMQSVSRGTGWVWKYKFRVAVLALVFMLAAPRPVKSQFLDPCCAIMEAGLSTIASTLSSVIGGGLNSILSVDKTIQNFEQTVVWPQQLISEAKALVGQLQGVFTQIRTVTSIPVASATLPTTQQLESNLLSANANQIGTTSQDYTAVYGTVPNQPDSELTEHYGAECRELHIMLIDDDVENVFPSSYAWWTAAERKCWGDGTSATRRTAEKPGGEPWTPCGNGCPELASGVCKPSGDLRFVLADFPRLGSVCRIHTSSYRSIRQIHSALQEIQTFTGGRLAGITGKLVVRPEEITYFDRKEKRKKTTSVWVLSLEVEGDDMRKLIANLTENARLFAETRKLLGPAGKVLEIVEEEQEQAPEINGEFYPPPANGSSPGNRNGNGSVETNTTDHVAGNGSKVVPPASAAAEPSNGKVGSNGSKPATGQPSSPATLKNGNGSSAGNGLNQLRNEFLMTARRIATATKRPIGDVIEQASGGSLKYGDIGRLTEADVPKLRAAIEQMAPSASPAAQ